jgi:K+-sensing histidine kinase KdpD
LLPKVKRTSERIALLVEELAELTTLRHGRLELRFEEFDLGDSVTQLVADHRTQENSTEVALDAEPMVGRWDRLRIEQGCHQTCSATPPSTAKGIP